MSPRTDERARLVAATANRLRMLQADLADEPAEVRCEHLDETVREALSRLVPEERPEFLAELEGAFPSWDGNVSIGAEVEGAAGEMDRRELEDPSFLVARLAELAPGLSDVQRRVLVDRLKEAGLAPKAQGKGPAWPEESEAKFRARVQVGEEEIDPGRVLELATLLIEVVASLDQVVWNTWKTVSPRSSLRRPSPLPATMGRFVCGDAEVGRGQVAQDTERLRQLTAALVSAVSQVGRQFAQGHAAKFSPTEIAALANMEGGGLLVSKEVKCWRKYVELAASLDEVAIEGEIMQALSAYAESLMKGLSAKA